MEPCVAGSLWSRSEPRTTRHVVSQSRSANPADQRWGFWSLLPHWFLLQEQVRGGLSLSCPWDFVQLGVFMSNSR